MVARRQRAGQAPPLQVRRRKARPTSHRLAQTCPDTVGSFSGSQPLVLPSVPVDALLDDHAVEFEECKRWANSEAGQAARTTNPAGFANVRAHAEAHLRAMATR